MEEPVKLYNSVGPNPRVVRMFMAERGIELPKTDIDLRGGENRRETLFVEEPRRADAGAGIRRRFGAHRKSPPFASIWTRPRRASR